ncbi:MAG TPA: phosphoglycerate dehydrogenase [Candidatus Handelsmanbacteria bacterium]|nr:phosphoglycerate dehydrogenase [Candidatus Handelsmanbacteria bacterium]
MKVLISDKVDAGCVTILQQGGIDVDVDTALSADDLLEAIGDYHGLIVRSATKVTGALIERAHGLRAVGRAGAGVDNIDVEAATRRGIVVMNTPGGNSVSTAEHSVAMLMALSRNVPSATASVKAGKWERSAFTGVELAGKTIAVIGLGPVGREVAERANGLRMRVIGHDLFMTDETIQSYGAQPADLDQVWAEADFVTFHIPLTPQTKYFLSTEQLARCKDGVRIINCARGGVVDEKALLVGLESGKVAGVALDVYEEEPPAASSKLIAHDNVICTPHLAASTQEAQSNVALQVAEQVRDVLVQGVIRNAVNVPSIEPEAYEKLRPYLDLGERMGRIQGQLAESSLERITIEYRGEVTGQATSPLTSAVLKGVMETFATAGSVNLVNAPVVAQERGIRVDELKSSAPEDYTSLLTVILEAGGQRRVLSGTLFGRRDPRVVRLDQYDIDAAPDGHMLFYLNDDIPGIIGRVGSTMGSHQVNIARMSCGRQQIGGNALTVLNVDSHIPQPVLDEILKDPHISWARQVAL